MQNKSKVWFTSDLHFKHSKITQLTNRGLFTTADEHEEWLVDLWNKQVKPEDTVWHLGDFCFSSKLKDWQELRDKLNGNIYFIKGNHDSSKVLKQVEKIHGFSSFLYKELTIEDLYLCLFHFPIASWNKQRYGSIMLHGHSHGGLGLDLGKALDVGLDSSYLIFGKHKFFDLQDIRQLMQDKQIFIADNHRN